jgi:hypothetical protein
VRAHKQAGILGLNGNNSSADGRIIAWRVFIAANQSEYKCVDWGLVSGDSAADSGCIVLPAENGSNFIVPIALLPVAILTQTNLRVAN